MSCPSLLVREANVPKVTSAKSVGEHIDEALTRAAHIEKTSKKLTSTTAYFDYCSVLWEGLGSELALKLQKLQNRAA